MKKSLRDNIYMSLFTTLLLLLFIVFNSYGSSITTHPDPTLTNHTGTLKCGIIQPLTMSVHPVAWFGTDIPVFVRGIGTDASYDLTKIGRGKPKNTFLINGEPKHSVYIGVTCNVVTPSTNGSISINWANDGNGDATINDGAGLTLSTEWSYSGDKSGSYDGNKHQKYNLSSGLTGEFDLETDFMNLSISPTATPGLHTITIVVTASYFNNL